MEHIIMAVPSDVWVMLFAAGVLGLTVALWWVELKPFINKITKLNSTVIVVSKNSAFKDRKF